MATLESLEDVSFISRVRDICLSLVDCGVDCAECAESKVVVLTEINIIQ